MRMLRRLFAATLGLAGALGLVVCVAGVVGCWVLHADLTDRTDRVFGRAEGSLDGVQVELVQVRDRLRQTHQELEAVRKREDELAARPQADRVGKRIESRKLVKVADDQLRDAKRMLTTATEAALVVTGFLDALAGLPLGERVGIEPDQLRGASDELSTLIGRADKLSALLAGAAPDDGTAAAQSSRIAESLDRVVAAVDEGADRTAGARDQVRTWHDRVIDWLTVVAVVITLILVWIGAGHLSLLLHARRV